MLWTFLFYFFWESMFFFFYARCHPSLYTESNRKLRGERIPCINLAVA